MNGTNPFDTNEFEEPEFESTTQLILESITHLTRCQREMLAAMQRIEEDLAGLRTQLDAITSQASRPREVPVLSGAFGVGGRRRGPPPSDESLLKAIQGEVRCDNDPAARTKV